VVFPRLLLVRQQFPDRSIKDVPATVRKELAEIDLARKLKPGARVAIAVGSRGIGNLSTIVRGVCDYWKSRGMNPFIVPAMGSHGGGTADGQAQVLARFGIDESSMGCPILSSLEVVELGTTAEGIQTYLDRQAFESEGVFLVNRVKWHTDFSGKLESGLCKMMTIGLGKLTGAKHYHTFGYRLGLERVIHSVAQKVLNSGKILGGLAILEDANHNTAQLTVVSAQEMVRREEELLALAKSWMGRIPVEDLDILIVDEMGKNISGTGMDTKVINRGMQGEVNPWPGPPRIERIFVRSLSPLSYGNAVGVGLADMVTDRLVEAIDWVPTRLNSLTASSIRAVRTPIHFASDRECLQALALTVGKLDPSQLTIGRIRNTLELNILQLSENLLGEAQGNPLLQILSGPQEWQFDTSGNLREMLC